MASQEAPHPDARPDLKEKPFSTVISVAFLVELCKQPDRIILVQKKDGLWALPSGRVEKGENISEAALREFEEETGIERECLVKHFPYLSPRSFQVIKPNKLSLGIVILAYYSGPRLNLVGWPVDDPDGDIVFARPFDMQMLTKLIDENVLSRPEFNLHPIMSFLTNLSPVAMAKCIYLVNWLKEKANDNPLLRYDSDNNCFKYSFIPLVDLPVHRKWKKVGLRQLELFAKMDL